MARQRRPTRVLIDGRIEARDGIGRYTRCTVQALRRISAPDVELHVLRSTQVAPYSEAEDAELVERARAVRADVVHMLNYRVPIDGLDAPLVVTVHDSAHLVAPELCFTDDEFVRYFGEPTMCRLKESAFCLEERAGEPAPPLPWHARYFRAMLRYTLTNAASVVVPTNALATDLRAFVPAAPLAVAAWGADHLPTLPAVLPGVVGAAPFVLFVSVARRYKGLGELAAGYSSSRSRSAGARLVLAGERCGPGGQAARALAEAGVRDAVLLGEVDDATLTALYRAASILVHPARFESFGFAPVEALTQGCAVVANDIPALREVLDDHAAFVDVCDSVAVADAIDAAAILGGSLATALREARIRHASRYRWRRHASQLQELYRHAAP